MHTDKRGLQSAFIGLLFIAASAVGQTVKISDYYPIADGNEWRYTAPPGWKDGDYVSQVKLGDAWGPAGKRSFLHYDATKAAKVLVPDTAGIFYVREEFAGGDGFAEFDKPLLWFPREFRIGQKMELSTAFTRHFKDGKTGRGTYKLVQTATRFEDANVPAGKFQKALRIESESFWDLGDGRTAKTESVYHYAKNVGVVKASARFIIFKDQKEIINRLVETDLKSYKLNKN